MSGKVSGAVWDLDLPRNEKYILLAFADHADHEGGNVRPSMALVAWKTGYSVPQVRRIVKKLVKDGIMIVEKERAGKPTLYRITTSAGIVRSWRDRNKPDTNPYHNSESSHSYDRGITQVTVVPESPRMIHEPSLKRHISEKEKEPTPLDGYLEIFAGAMDMNLDELTSVKRDEFDEAAREMRKAGVLKEHVSGAVRYAQRQVDNYTFKAALTPRLILKYVNDYMKDVRSGKIITAIEETANHETTPDVPEIEAPGGGVDSISLLPDEIEKSPIIVTPTTQPAPAPDIARAWNTTLNQAKIEDWPRPVVKALEVATFTEAEGEYTLTLASAEDHKRILRYERNINNTLATALGQRLTHITLHLTTAEARPDLTVLPRAKTETEREAS